MKKIVVILVIILLVGCSKGKVKESNTATVLPITAEEVQRMITSSENFTLIDVRTKVEYESGHLSGAINIELDDIQSITLDKDMKIIVYCQSGRRSAQAASQLVSLGYRNVYDLGGIIDWPYLILGE